MLGWGMATMALGAVNNFAGLVVVRFLLGAFEAGLFPGMIYCLTFWYKQDERAIRAALILACGTLGMSEMRNHTVRTNYSLGGAFGGAIAFAVGHMNGIRGLEAWRWLFILEGAPSCACAILVFFFFPDFPETASWLSPDERELAIERIKGVASLGHAKVTWPEAKETLTDWRLYVHFIVYISVSVPVSSIGLFTPTIVSGLGYESLDAQLFTAPPYAVAFLVAVLLSWQSDKRGMRSRGAFFALAISGVSFLAQGPCLNHKVASLYVPLIPNIRRSVSSCFQSAVRIAVCSSRVHIRQPSSPP